jgi:hypothetical protein
MSGGQAGGKRGSDPAYRPAYLTLEASRVTLDLGDFMNFSRCQDGDLIYKDTI